MTITGLSPVQRADNFIQWISHYPGKTMYWIRHFMPLIVTYPLDKLLPKAAGSNERQVYSQATSIKIFNSALPLGGLEVLLSHQAKFQSHCLQGTVLAIALK